MILWNLYIVQHLSFPNKRGYFSPWQNKIFDNGSEFGQTDCNDWLVNRNPWHQRCRLFSEPGQFPGMFPRNTEKMLFRQPGEAAQIEKFSSQQIHFGRVRFDDFLTLWAFQTSHWPTQPFDNYHNSVFFINCVAARRNSNSFLGRGNRENFRINLQRNKIGKSFFFNFSGDVLVQKICPKVSALQ